MAELLDFEEPIAVLQKEIEALRLMPSTPERLAAIQQLEDRATSLRVASAKAVSPSPSTKA